MYIAIYNKDREHIANITDTTHDLTQRVYDHDNFAAEGICGDDINNATLAILNTDEGGYQYACLVDNITPNGHLRSLKGADFKTLWEVEVLIDYTSDGSFDGRLSKIFEKVAMAVFSSPDMTINKIPVRVAIPEDLTDTTSVYGSKQGKYEIVDAYKYLKGYLKYYEYNIESYYDVASEEIIFIFVKHQSRLEVNLRDFIYELTTTSNVTNVAVATLKYDVETPETDESGNIIYTTTQKTDESGELVYDNGNPVYIPKYKPRPPTLATIYYYRDEYNNIVPSDDRGNIPNRIYPVKRKWFESEFLADAQYDAVYELADARYVDNIIIDANAALDPIDFAAYPLYTKVDLYYDGQLYKTLPITEKMTKVDSNGNNTKIKLGFKRILLTEIIKSKEA